MLAPGGELFIGFGPLWKSPTGGRIDFMTGMPWAHLLFPERVVMAERWRFRPDEDYRGLNKMTLARFRSLMGATGLECRSFATNVSDNRVVKAMGAIARLPGMREYFTTSVYGVWRKRADAGHARRS